MAGRPPVLADGVRELGRMVPEENEETIREIILRPYRIIYKVLAEEQMIGIARIWHAARGEPDIPGQLNF